MASDNENLDVTPPKRSKPDENKKNQLDVLNDVLQSLNLPTLDLSGCDEVQKEISIRDCAKTVHDKILENFDLRPDEIETRVSDSSVGTTTSQLSDSVVSTCSRQSTGKSPRGMPLQSITQNEAEITVRVLQREIKLMKSKNHWYTFLLCKLPDNVLIEAFSYNRNDYMALKTGHTYNITSGFYMKSKKARFAKRSRTEIKDEFFFSEISAKEIGEFTAVDHGEEFFPSDSTTIPSFQSMCQQKPPYEFKYRLVKDVILKSGNLYRYIGCKFCAKSLTNARDNDELYRCTSCKTQGSPDEMFKSYTIIQDLTIEDLNGNRFRDIVCFNSVVEILLGKKSEDVEIDNELDSIFNNLLGSKLNLRLSCNATDSQFSALGYGVVADFIKIVSVNSHLKMDDQKENFAVDANPIPSGPVVKGLKVKVSEELNFEICLNEDETEELRSMATYYLQSKPTGYALIINISRYSSQDDRDGSKQDVIKLTGVLTNLNFKVFGNNPDKEYSYKEIFDKIDDFKKRLRKNKISSCMVIVMGHGELDAIKSSEGTPIYIETIIDQFSHENFQQFSLKPKMFIFGMCRPIGGGGAAGFPKEEVSDQKNTKKEVHDRKFPNIENAYFCFPCPPGYYSARTTSKGTVFIDRVVLGLRKHAAKLDFKSMLDEVQHKMNDDKQPYTLEYSDGRVINTRLMPLEHFGQVFRKFYFRVARNSEDKSTSELDYLHEKLRVDG